MTREQVKELLPVMQAFAEGREVQYAWRNPDRPYPDWATDNDPVFNDRQLKWRIKPAPREWWLLVSKYGRVAVTSQAPDLKEVAIDCEVVHVREVASE
jgi:hypothetical protein